MREQELLTTNAPAMASKQAWRGTFPAGCAGAPFLAIGLPLDRVIPALDTPAERAEYATLEMSLPFFHEASADIALPRKTVAHRSIMLSLT